VIRLTTDGGQSCGEANASWGRVMNKNMIRAMEEAASKCQAQGQYSEAAENYARAAAAYLDDNALIYAQYSHEAFRMWLKAKNAANALQQARAVFRVLDDTGWLKKSMEEVLDLKQMIDEFNAADFGAEGDTFASEFNEKLGEFGLMLRPRPGPQLRATCPECGAPLPHFLDGDEIKCSFCGYVMRTDS